MSIAAKGRGRLTEEERAPFAHVVEEGRAEAVSKRLGLGRETFIRLAGGLPVRNVTLLAARAALRDGLVTP